jgi:hypothetical protein
LQFHAALSNDATPRYFEATPTSSLSLYRIELNLDKTCLDALSQSPEVAKKIIIQRFVAILMRANVVQGTNLGAHFYAAVKDVLAEALSKRQAAINGFVPAATYAFANLISEYLARCGSRIQSAQGMFNDKIADFLDRISRVKGRQHALKALGSTSPEADNSIVIDVG